MPITMLRSSLVLATLGLSALPLSSVSEARSPFDGRWHVEAVSDPGKCSDKYSVAIQVANGRISGAFLGAAAGGRVDARGRLNLHIDVVRATGALVAMTGSGRWKSPTCNGSWIARRA